MLMKDMPPFVKLVLVTEHSLMRSYFSPFLFMCSRCIYSYTLYPYRCPNPLTFLKIMIYNEPEKQLPKRRANNRRQKNMVGLDFPLFRFNV